MKAEEKMKGKFFAHYWGVKCMYVGGVGLATVGEGGWNLKHPDFFLELKLITGLNDEDYKYIVCNLCNTTEDNFKKFSSDYNKQRTINAISDFQNTDVRIIDFLRSKGYLVPFMNYSIDDLISFGWCRISKPIQP